MRYKGIIFDMDGTLTVPLLDFKRMRLDLGITDDKEDIAEVIESWPEPRRTQGWQMIEKHEKEASVFNQLQPDALEVISRFASGNIKLAIITRNTLESVQKLLETKLDVTFDPILTREFPHMKPSPEPVRHILEQWNMAPDECLMVGDYIHDIQSANAAGAVSCYYKNPQGGAYESDADFTVKSYKELEQLVFGGNE
jgi:HAD superfamily hydrolase (TIGR01549 family)